MNLQLPSDRGGRSVGMRVCSNRRFMGEVESDEIGEPVKKHLPRARLSAVDRIPARTVMAVSKAMHFNRPDTRRNSTACS